MAADEYLARQAAPDGAAFRVYRWSPSAISLGFHQNVLEVNTSIALEQGWDVVRRPTGGRTLLHHGDLSYSLTLAGGTRSPDLLKRVYAGVASALGKALGWLRVRVDEGATSSPQQNSALAGHHLCLMSNVRGELQVGGKKIAAAAQRIYPNGLLQHGSIPLTGDVAAVVDCSTTLSDPSAAKFQLRKSAAALDEVAGRLIAAEELTAIFIREIEAEFSLVLQQDDWRPEELDQIRSLEPIFDLAHNKNSHANAA